MGGVCLEVRVMRVTQEFLREKYQLERILRHL